MTAGPREEMIARYERFQAGLKDGRGGWTLPVRRAAMERFARVGFPTPKDEPWKYTNVSPIFSVPFELDGAGAVRGPSAEEIAALAGQAAGPRLVFVNGRFQAGLSRTAGLPAGVVVKNLSAAFAEDAPRLAPHLSNGALAGAHGFFALNTAFVEDGALIVVPEGAAIAEPIELVFVAAPGDRPLAFHPRVLIVAGAASQATVVESYLAAGEGVSFTNAVTQVALGPDARVEHYKLEAEAPGAFHLASIRAQQERGSHFGSCSIALGGAIARTEIGVTLGAEGASCTLNGLYMADGRQHLDHHTRIEHAGPRCTSRQLYKGVVDGQGHGVFTGQIVVQKDAQKSDASQSNKNLLLSEEAVVDTTPRLEIFADDVRCTHGATVGQLDENAIFYLRSRGIDERVARGLLTYAFAGEMVGLIRPEPLRARVRELVARKLPRSSRPEELENP